MDSVECVVEGVIAIRAEELERPEVPAFEAHAHALHVGCALRRTGIAAGGLLSLRDLASLESLYWRQPTDPSNTDSYIDYNAYSG